MGTFCVVLNTLVDVGAVFGAARLLKSELAGGRRSRVLGTASGVALVGLGLYVAVSRRGAYPSIERADQRLVRSLCSAAHVQR